MTYIVSVLACDTEIGNVGTITSEVSLLTGIDATELRGAGSGTGGPYARPAAAGVLGAPSCAPHAREQSVYPTLGELAEACGVVSDRERQVRNLGNETLIEMLGRMQRALDGRLAREMVRPSAQRRVPS